MSLKSEFNTKPKKQKSTEDRISSLQNKVNILNNKIDFFIEQEIVGNKVSKLEAKRDWYLQWIANLQG